ncbi:MAG: ATP-binding cassette domain-containing protein [Myxococcales bacterium]|nr:MAG: ATP-binding cassette domain-containing protein [Myxococcales bacterium]
MITVANLTKKYGPVTAVNDISFEVRQGEILGFLGPNGAGKTTTMKVITGYLNPTAGKTTVKGLDTVQHPLETKRAIGYVPESFPLYEDMMVYDYLQHIAEIREIPAAQRPAKIREMVDVCGLTAVIAKDITELSRGYRQRVGLAQAMIHDPDILILDEPTSGLDPNQIVEIRHLIKRLGERKTVILSTHILSEVTATCNRVIIINEGKVVADGTPEQLLERDQSNNFLTLQLGADYDNAEPLLARVDFVASAKRLSANGAEHPTFLVESRKNSDIRAKVFQLAVEKGWTILEMHTEAASLEDVFRKLTVQ